MRKPAAFVLACLLLGIAADAESRSDNTVTTREGESGRKIAVSFDRGKAWVHHMKIGGLLPIPNRPQIAVWAEDPDGRFLGTLYVTHRTATQDWRTSNSAVRRPEALPCWAHRQGTVYEDGLPLPTKQHPLPDALTSATPKDGFTLNTIIPNSPDRILIRAELNHSLDFNAAFPKGSMNGQPSVIYTAEVSFSGPEEVFVMSLSGYGSPTGSTGAITPDVSTLTTAKDIVRRITVRIK